MKTEEGIFIDPIEESELSARLKAFTQKHLLKEASLIPADPKADYYDIGGIPTIEIIKAKLGRDAYFGFLLGNIIKYACRLDHKKQALRDAEKIKVYAEMLIKELTKE